MTLNPAFKKRLVTFCATAGGLGRAPQAPGTFGTLAGIPFVFLFAELHPLFSLLLTFAMVLGAIWISQMYQSDLGGHDRQEIVIDEVVGFIITMTMIPLTWQAWVAGFVVFRILDMTKPWPISVLDRKVKGGLGVVVDDVAAGLVANMILQIVLMKTDWLGVQIVTV